MYRLKIFFILCLAPIVGLSLLSCSENDEYVSPLQNVNIGDIHFQSLADTSFIIVEKIDNSNFIAESSESWCSIKLGYNRIQVSVLSNISIYNRTAKIRIIDKSDGTSLEFNAVQNLDLKTLGNSIITESLVLVSNDNNCFRPFLVSDNDIHVHIPKDVNLDSIGIRYEQPEGTVFIDGYIINKTEDRLFSCSDFKKPHVIRLSTTDGVDNTWNLLIYDIPVVAINTPYNVPIVSKTDRVEGCEVSLIDEKGIMGQLGTAGIRGRGNSSWLMEKKPYNVRLDKKHELLGMKASKHWILLANCYLDRTQLRNSVAFEMARLTDYPWVQSGQFVELILNGIHQGLYYLCEKVGVEKGKIDIVEMKPSDISGEELTGGYLLESTMEDGDIRTDYFNRTGCDFAYKLAWELKSPEDNVPTEQYEYIKNALNHLEMLIWNEDSLRKGTYKNYFDVETAINWWLVEESTANEEASRTKNFYLYKDRGGKFKVGPPWDFDAYSFGTGGLNYFHCSKVAFYFRNLFKDKLFVNRIKEKWGKYLETWMNDIPAFIDKQYLWIKNAASRNEVLWPRYDPHPIYGEETFKESIEHMKYSLIEQLIWMNNSIMNNDFDDGYGTK